MRLVIRAWKRRLTDDLDYVSNQEIIQAARRNLPQDVWDYLTAAPSRKPLCGAIAWASIAWRSGRGCWWMFKDRHIDDVSRTEAAHSGDDGAHRFAASITPEGGIA